MLFFFPGTYWDIWKLKTGKKYIFDMSLVNGLAWNQANSNKNLSGYKEQIQTHFILNTVYWERVEITVKYFYNIKNIKSCEKNDHIRKFHKLLLTKLLIYIHIKNKSHLSLATLIMYYYKQLIRHYRLSQGLKHKSRTSFTRTKHVGIWGKY